MDQLKHKSGKRRTDAIDDNYFVSVTEKKKWTKVDEIERSRRRRKKGELRKGETWKWGKKRTLLDAREWVAVGHMIYIIFIIFLSVIKDLKKKRKKKKCTVIYCTKTEAG